MKSRKERSPITTHVLDTARGRPAEGISARLEIEAPGGWTELSNRTTDSDGRVENFLAPDYPLKPGVYRVTFETGPYLTSCHKEGFYPEVTISFAVKASDQHYHVPLLLSPFGYSTYRGS